jgi:hypothetical protein
VQCYFLEVAIESTMSGPLLLDAVELQPAAPGTKCWKIRPAPAVLPESIAPAAAGGREALTTAAAGVGDGAVALYGDAVSWEGQLGDVQRDASVKTPVGNQQMDALGKGAVSAAANGVLANGLAGVSLREEDTTFVRDGDAIAAPGAAAKKQGLNLTIAPAHNGYHDEQQQQEQLVQAAVGQVDGASAASGWLSKTQAPGGPLMDYISSFAQPLYAGGGVRHYLWEVHQVEQTTAAATGPGDGASTSSSSNSVGLGKGKGFGGAEVPAASVVRPHGGSSSSSGGGPSPVLGKLDICWSGLNGEVGRLQTQAVMWPGPRAKEVQLHLEGIRVPGLEEVYEGERGGLWTVPSEQPFQVVLGVSVSERVRRESSSHADGGSEEGGAMVGPLELLFTEMVAPTGQRRGSIAGNSRSAKKEEHEEGNGIAGVVALGSRKACLGCLRPGTATTVALDCMALQPGWQVLPPIVLVMDGKALDSVHDVEVLVS